ncbi:hypothetical protein PHLGIDRAFT_202599 [Phlebiopsis gigantea 11061_1 CR5-6]|uniref:VWFA domain-containing protein n=1 Tax=Phlebiopsis gigantea (strain 11061_1 CR5-6) TaxID=745531 RepID=A0A0C3RTX3_PHLG1|nr:hypothetical protein PHLGIDRAFT_202599 [Phlebiopsis gigantea 11061_1 CR5-6]
MFHSIATREAEGTHATLGTRFPSRTCFRLCPQLALDHTKINDPHEIELATTKWLDSREGRTQMRSVVEALLGVPLLAEPPVPPEDIAQGYNPILDRARPNDIDHWLKDYRVVYLVDDSSSMEPHWQEVASALAGIAQESRGNDANSFSIRFVKSTLQENGVASPAAVISAMQNIQPFGSNVLGPRLEEILQEQIQTIDASIQQSQYAEVKPLHIVVLTTGDFPDYLQNVLANVGQQKASKNLHPNSLKIQFVLVGDSPTGASHLRDVQTFDPGHVVDVSLSFGDFSAGRLKYNLLSTLHPNTVSTLAPAQTSVPFLFPSEPSDGIPPPAPRIQSPRAPIPRMQAPRVATPQQTTYEPEEGTPIVSLNSVGAGPLPGGHGVFQMHVHSPFGMPPEAMLHPQNFPNLQRRGGFSF